MNDSGQQAPSANDDGRSRWGRVKFGGRRMPALRTATPIGIVLAAGIAALVVALGQAGPRPMIGGVAVAAVSVWPCIAFVWVLLVDRDTLRGAIPNAEQSIESAWLERAGAGAFSDTLLITGLGTATIAFTGTEVPTLLALSAVIVVSMVAFGIRYVVQRRRG